MKNTAIAITMMTLVLIGTTLAQPTRRVAGSTAMGGGSGVGVKNRQPMNMRKRIDKATPLTQAQDGSGTDNANRQRSSRPNAVGNPFGLGGTVTAGVKNRQAANLGDTATHEVGHKGNRAAQTNPRNRRPNSMKLGDIKGEVINSQQPNAAKYDGIDGESNDARTKNPNGRRKTQNLLPYMEQSNLKTRPQSKQFGAGNQVEAKTKANGN